MKHHNIIYTLTFSGYADFPFDMLRYDCCWPSDPAAIVTLRKIESDKYNNIIPYQPYTIRVSSYTDFSCDRWSSFGWIPKNSI